MGHFINLPISPVLYANSGLENVIFTNWLYDHSGVGVVYFCSIVSAYRCN